MMSTQQKSLRRRRYLEILRGAARVANWALIQPIARWNKRRATIATLSKLDDRILADIGIERGEIEQVANWQLRHLGSSPTVEPIPPPVRPVNAVWRTA